MKLYDLEQNNSHEKNTISKTQKVIKNMKCINMINIYSKNHFLKEFIEDLDDEEEESIKKEDIN